MNNKPYFYIIKHIPSQKYYAGCKINSKANSLNLMTEGGYQSSSKIIKELIIKDSLSQFNIIRVKHFDTSEEALLYETRFLTKVNAANNIMFYNRHNGGKSFVNTGGYKLSEYTKQKMKKPKTSITIEKQNIEKRSRDKSVYIKAVKTRKQNNSNRLSDERKEQIRVHNATWWDIENRQKQSEIMKNYFKANPVSESTKQKHREKSIGPSNGMYGKTHNEMTKEKLRLAWQKRKEKKKQSLSSLSINSTPIEYSKNSQSFSEEDLF